MYLKVTFLEKLQLRARNTKKISISVAQSFHGCSSAWIRMILCVLYVKRKYV